VVKPYSTWLSEFSSVFQEIVADDEVMLEAEIAEIIGGVVSPGVEGSGGGAGELAGPPGL